MKTFKYVTNIDRRYLMYYLNNIASHFVWCECSPIVRAKELHLPTSLRLCVITQSSASLRSSKALNSSVISSAQWATETYTHFRGTSGCFTRVEDISLRENLRAPCDNGGLFTELSRRAEGKTGARGLLLSTILHTYNVATSWVRTLFMLRP